MPTDNTENKPIERTVQMTDIPFAPIPIPLTKQFIDRINPNVTDSPIEMILFPSLSTRSDLAEEFPLENLLDKIVHMPIIQSNKLPQKLAWKTGMYSVTNFPQTTEK